MTEKKFFKMKETCEKLGLAAHVIRFWESEIPQLTIRKNGSGHRVFSHQDIRTLEHIKSLLHEDGLSLAGVRKRLKSEASINQDNQVEKDVGSHLNSELIGDLEEVRELIQEMIIKLDSP